ncbi:hemolysin XhlA family protein [Anianabacter salinae]|uniref:hemolysin XhlA family protein n=1 Tax=Anianabacter salinae TaxID=2851023 RepID=UPI00225E0EC3|nr:hemolysin XhlA family protein [Anianabacter salinae]MBV0911550.1 hemolysin XhlA family protein [Anianabacter salinae]
MTGTLTLDTDWRRHIEKRVQSLELHGAVDDVHRANVETRLSAIEDTLKWLVRLILGAFLAGAVAYALRGGLAVP